MGCIQSIERVARKVGREKWEDAHCIAVELHTNTNDSSKHSSRYHVVRYLDNLSVSLWLAFVTRYQLRGQADTYCSLLSALHALHYIRHKISRVDVRAWHVWEQTCSNHNLHSLSHYS